MSNINEFNNTTYKSAIQREMKKINVNSGCLCDFNGPVGNRAAAELITNILIDNGVCDYVTENGVLSNNQINQNNQDNSNNQNSVNTNRRNRKKIILDFPQEFTSDEEALIVRSIEREREDIDNIIERIENIILRSRRRRRSCFCKRHREHNMNRDNIAYIERIQTANTDRTNVYRFINQNFLDNLTGKSNIDISNLNNNPVQRRIQIEEILKKYGKI